MSNKNKDKSKFNSIFFAADTESELLAIAPLENMVSTSPALASVPTTLKQSCVPKQVVVTKSTESIP